MPPCLGPVQVVAVGRDRPFRSAEAPARRPTTTSEGATKAFTDRIARPDIQQDAGKDIGGTARAIRSVAGAARGTRASLTPAARSENRLRRRHRTRTYGAARRRQDLRLT